MHELIQVAAGWFGGICQEGIIKIHTEGLRKMVITKRYATLRARPVRVMRDEAWLILSVFISVSRDVSADCTALNTGYE